jgi:hypothetical protein
VASSLDLRRRLVLNEQGETARFVTFSSAVRRRTDIEDRVWSLVVSLHGVGEFAAHGRTWREHRKVLTDVVACRLGRVGLGTNEEAGRSDPFITTMTV